MNIDSSVYDITIAFGELNCGDSFIYMNHLYIKSEILLTGIKEYRAVRLWDGEAINMDAGQPVRVVKTKVLRDNS